MVELFESHVIAPPVPVAAPCGLPAPHRRMAALAAGISAELPLIECPVRHHFSRGVYGREMFIPAGTVVVGKIHKYENMLVMTQGVAHLVDDDGEPRVVQAPMVCVSPPGVQRAVYAVTDCIFISIHGTEKKNVNEIESEFIASDALEYQRFLLEDSTVEG